MLKCIVLLRTLEHFEGIMFLTTNRVASIDSAFKSRIHLSLSYPALTADARRKIWNSFITQDSSVQRPCWLDDRFLDRLAQEPINGRQIKNLVRMARALAANDQREIEPADITIGLAALKDFESEFTEARNQRRREDLTKTSLIATRKVSSMDLSAGYVFAVGLTLATLFVSQVMRKWN